jgi:hypothetical protein
VVDFMFWGGEQSLRSRTSEFVIFSRILKRVFEYVFLRLCTFVHCHCVFAHCGSYILASFIL